MVNGKDVNKIPGQATFQSLTRAVTAMNPRIDRGFPYSVRGSIAIEVAADGTAVAGFRLPTAAAIDSC